MRCPRRQVTGVGVGPSGRWRGRGWWRWWLVLWVLSAGLWAVGEDDPSWATSPTDQVGDSGGKAGADGPVTDHHCDNGDRVDGTCRACADRFYWWTSRGCEHRTVPHPLDYLCSAGESYYSAFGCRQVYCPRGPPHGESARDANGHCLPPIPPTTPPPPPLPGAPRDVSVTAGLGSLTVSWQPAASGGEPDGWEVHYSHRAGGGATAKPTAACIRWTARPYPPGA